MKTGYAIVTAVLVVLIAGGFYLLLGNSKHPSSSGTTTSLPTSDMTMNFTSPAFSEGGLIPAKYTCDGENVNPELRWSGAPEGTKSFVLIMDDPDIPDSVKKSLGTDVFDHWVVYNILPGVKEIAEASKPLGQEGLNGAGKTGYTGPCPPDKEHRYFFYLLALDRTLTFPAQPTKADVIAAVQYHILGQAELMGRYDRKR
jgi:hypothetical protein